jgi:exosome complex component RRP4
VNVIKRNRRDVVIPGTVLNPPNEKMQAGDGTFREGKDVVANVVGLRNQRGSYMNLIPMSGRYIPRPRKNDLIIGIITDTAQSYWTVDINSPYTAMLHVNDTPWRVDFGETVRYLNNGDAIIARISDVGELRKVFVSIKEKGLRRLESGHIIEMAPSKVPRVIGKKGSMLSMLKSYTDCRIFVGQNGRLWVQGDHKNVLVLEEAVRRIEAMSHMPGLTTEVEAFLRSRLGEPKMDPRDQHDRDDRRDSDRRGPEPRKETKPGGGVAEEPPAEVSEPVETAETAEVTPVGEAAEADGTGEPTVESVPEETSSDAIEPETTAEPEDTGAGPKITIVGSDGGPAEATPEEPEIEAGIEPSEDIEEKTEMKILEEEGDE